MKYSISAAVVAVVQISGVAAWPTMMDKITGPLAENALAKKQILSSPQGAGALPLLPPPFDAKSQLIDVTGAHAFVAPGPGDDRGECPGLNALANHGYLPHNGRATIQQFIDATTSVYGMGADLAGFLSLYGALVDGDGTGWSIKGLPHTGIGGSHNDYEADSSPTHADLNQYGNNYKLVMSQWKELYALQPNAATANYNLEVLRTFRGQRFAESVAKNPYFSYLPFTGIEVSQAAFTFIYRFMANHTAEAPEGILNQDTLKSFFAISGSDSNPVWTEGHERIPNNWYRRSQADAYTIPYFELDILYFAETVPETLSIGCNTGAVNSYNTITAETLTNGAFTTAQLLANPICFATQFALAEAPGVTGLSASALGPLTNLVNSLTSSLNCASIGSVNTSALTICPGFSFYGGPTGPVAPGAIQS